MQPFQGDRGLFCHENGNLSTDNVLGGLIYTLILLVNPSVRNQSKVLQLFAEDVFADIQLSDTPKLLLVFGFVVR